MKKIRSMQVLFAATACLVSAWALGIESTSSTYEISIYDSIPLYFWIAIVAGYIMFSIGLVIPPRESTKGLMGANLLGLTGINLLLGALPTLRYGTYYTQWDIWIYLGQTSYITNTGRLDLTTNFYPGLHLLWTSVALATGESVYTIGMLLAAPIEALRIPLVFVLTSRMFGNRTTAAYASVLASIPDGFIGTYASPWSYSLTLLLVFLVALSMRHAQIGFSATLLAILLALALVVAHPLAPLFLLIAFAVSPVVNLVARRMWKQDTEASPNNLQKLSVRGIVAILIVVYVTWIAYQTLVLQVSVSRLLAAFTEAGVLSPATFGRFLTPVLLAKIFGASAILGTYWLGGVAYVRRAVPNHTLSIQRLAISLVIAGILTGVVFEIIASSALLGDFVQRPLNVVALVLPILGGVFLERKLVAGGQQARKVLWTSAACAIPFVLALAAMYPSPYVSLFNYQNTSELYAGVDWSASHIPVGPELFSNSYLGRYAFYPWYSGNSAYSRLYHVEDTLPGTVTELASQGLRGNYVLIDQESVEVATADLRAWSFPNVHDVEVLQRLAGVSRVYDNGEVQIYLL